MTNIWEKTKTALRQDASYRNMFHMMEQYADKTAAELRQKDGTIRTRSYREYIEMSYAACGNLQRRGLVAAGDIVGFAYDTCMDWGVLFWGILMAGATPLLLNPTQRADNLCSVLDEANAKAYISANAIEGSRQTHIPASEILKQGEAGRENWSEHVALCTSGTTGGSRIFLYHAKTITSQLLAFDEAKKRNDLLPVNGRPTKLLAFLPFHHVFGFSVTYILYSCTGQTVVYLRDKSVPTVLEACRTEGVTNVYCVPMFFNALAASIQKQLPVTENLPEQVKKAVQSKLLGTEIRCMITGGGHVLPSTMRVLNDIGYPLHNGFGMTECGVICVETSTDREQRKKGSIGIPFAPTEYKIEENGELCIRGDVLYSASIEHGKIVPRSADEWFHTGDLMREESDGLYIVGRLKDVIINASGENIYPDIVEDAFIGLQGVQKYCVLGLKKDAYEEVCLILEADAQAFDANVAVEAIHAINRTLNENERVTRILLSKQPLPVSGSLKIQRRKLREAIEAGAWEFEELGKKADVKSEIKAILADMFSMDISEIGDHDDFHQVLGGNSLTIYSAMTEMENRYNIVLNDDEVAQIHTLDEAVRVVEAKLRGTKASIAEEMPKETHRITDFRESEEYKSLKQRMASTFTEETNPYFLAHDSMIRDTSVIKGNRVVNLGSYNYLGMSGNPETMQAAIDAIKAYGTSASGSRTLAGEKTLYQKLEKTIAAWKHTEDAIACTGGWATNLSFISSFMREGDFILYDALSHNSIAEGVALSKAESKAFPHNDLRDLERLLRRTVGKYNKVLIVVEGVYSMDGDIAPIPEFVRLKKQYGCFLMVDEAHSGGVLGDHAGGCDDYFHLDPKDIDIKYGTMSKALGTCGGYIAADHAIIEYLRYTMNGFVFTAGIAPPLAAACMKAIEIIQRDNTAVTNLHRNIAYFVRRCKEEGMNTCLAKESGIVPILIGSDADAALLSAELLKRGVFIPPAMYPAVPLGESRLRVTVSATHSIEQLEYAVSTLAKLMRERGFL